MSRSGYDDDFGSDLGYNALALYRQAVKQSIRGRRGQALLCRLRDALDAMPVKRLITGEIRNKDTGDVCAFGAISPTLDAYDADDLAPHFNIPRSLAAEIVYMNDEYEWKQETPEQRWTRMRAWVDRQIAAPSSPGSPQEPK